MKIRIIIFFLFFLISCSKKQAEIEFIPFKWAKEKMAVLIPITFEGIKEQTYFQLDTGTNHSYIKFCIFKKASRLEYFSPFPFK